MKGALRPDEASLDDLRLERLQRVIENAFDEIARTRMAGLPFVNPALGVSLRGLQRVRDEDVGVLVTPWFMNLIALPDDQSQRRKVGTKSRYLLPAGTFEVVWSHEESVGGYWSASLFSPMNEFADMETAVATADEALTVMFTRPEGSDDEEQAEGAREAIVTPSNGRGVEQRLAEVEAAAKATEAEDQGLEEGEEAAAPVAPEKAPQAQGLNRRSLFGMRRRTCDDSEMVR